MITGFALVDKAAGWTSHDVVGRLRRLYDQRRVGHAGTLDPMATGVLVVGLGAATRLLRFVQGQDKTYEATIRLGVGTVTDDAEGEVVLSPGWEWNPAALSAAVVGLTGSIEQVPSAVSAVKVDGVRSYSRVRAGETVDLPARPVVIRALEVVGPPRTAGDVVDVDVRVRCSSGTYVRALARDLGAAVGSAGHLTALRRTAVGPIEVAECEPLGERPPPVVPVDMLMGRLLEVWRPDALTVDALRHGRSVRTELADGTYLVVEEAAWVSVVEVEDARSRILVNAPHSVPGAGHSEGQP
jgi:tRNA pseudouridine55 synthase